MLPRRIPIFPLPNVVLFPEVVLPLHIFEPRYRQMVIDVDAGDGLVGMVLLRPGGEKPVGGPADTWGVGCAGRMIRKTMLPDGRSNILLRGLREFDLVERFDDQPYRTADVDWRPETEPTPLDAPFRERLIAEIREYVGPKKESELPLLKDPNLPDDLLVNLFAFALDLPPDDKQALLEESRIDHRGSRLLETLQFQLRLKRAAPGGGSETIQ